MPMTAAAVSCPGPSPEPRGLTSEEARARLARAGSAEPLRSRHEAAVQFAALFANPLVLILLIASGISAFLGELVSALIIVVIVLLGIAINFVQTYRSQRALERLRRSLTPTATVIRDGRRQEIPRPEVVQGDIVCLAAGDMVPADALLLAAKDLHVQEAALTGESMPVEKQAAPAQAAAGEPAAGLHTVFLGTSVVSGSGVAVVTATGRDTVFGQLAARLAAKPPETQFEAGMRRFSLFIMQTVVFLVLFVFLVSVALRHDPLQSLLFAVALAVGLTPEFLPMIMAVTLAQGAVRMGRRQVIVKHLAAMQNFGSMDILCSDKTGTLTSGAMRLHQALGPFGQPANRPLALAYLNSLHETGIKSPLDAAILQTAAPDVSGYRKRDEIPFDFERRRLSVVVDGEGRTLLISKGAPEGLLEICSHYDSGGHLGVLDGPAREQCRAAHERLGREGFRVLAVACREVADQPAYHPADERNLTLVGFLAFCDPPLEDAADAVADLVRDGVQVKLLTGDNELVARYVGDQVGLDGARLVRGEEIDQMTDAALGHVAETCTIFARVSPAQKNRIVLALKLRGHVVGFLGDGINDAPSLHAADVGISVAGGVDIARDAADIILLERSLRVLHAGIIEGRKAFGNVMKCLLMETSSNFGNMFSMAAASLLLPFLPMLPLQVLLNNFLYDVAQITIPTDHVDPTFIHKPRRWDIALIRQFMLVVGPVSSVFDFLTFWLLLTIFHGSQIAFHTGWFVESLATQTLVLFVIRTAGNPLRSPPSLPLVATVLGVTLIGLALPFAPFAGVLGFTPLPADYYLFVAAVTAAYLVLVECVKRRLMRRFVP